jgi:hypothetical protein
LPLLESAYKTARMDLLGAWSWVPLSNYVGYVPPLVLLRGAAGEKEEKNN